MGHLELVIQKLKSSAYHPFDPGGDWDEGIHLLLFAIRESVQESFVCIPFGLEICGTLFKLLKGASNDNSVILIC